MRKVTPVPDASLVSPLYTDGIHPDARFPRDRYRELALRLQGQRLRRCFASKRHPKPIAMVLLAHEPAYVDRFLQGRMDPKEVRELGSGLGRRCSFPELHIVGVPYRP